MMDWTEKYRPKNLNEIIGNKKTVTTLQQWATEWVKNKPKKQAVILSGKPGVGKTSCAYALAHQFQWIPIELNTSDARNRQRINAVTTVGSHHQSFTNNGTYISTKTGGRKLIILDEADNLYERISGNTSGSSLSDKGGKKAIVETVQTTQQPIILIVNDYYQLIKGSGKPLQKTCHHLSFQQPRQHQIYQLLDQICTTEQITIEPSVLQQLSTHCAGDIRSAIRDLQSLCIGRNHILHDATLSLGFRDHTEIIFDVLTTIFKTTDIPTIKQVVRHIDLDPQMLLYWINENIPRIYTSPKDVAQAYHQVSLADIYLSRTFNRSNYRMWAYATDHMSCGTSLVKTMKPSHKRFQYPVWLRKRKKRNTVQETIVIQQLALMHHCSLKKAKQELLPLIKAICKNKGIELTDFFSTDDENKRSNQQDQNQSDETISAPSQEKQSTEQKEHHRQKTLFS